MHTIIAVPTFDRRRWKLVTRDGAYLSTIRSLTDCAIVAARILRARGCPLGDPIEVHDQSGRTIAQGMIGKLAEVSQ
jgi:hypothetical protein